MKKLFKLNILIVFATIAAFTTSCESEDDFNPQISAITSTNDNVNAASQGFPSDLIVTEGIELDEMKSIYFVAGGDSVNVVFNPVLNSSDAVMFNVPFDEKKGSKLGAQEIVFENTSGVVLTQPFTILQPEPEVKIFVPARPKAGESTVATGEWFQNLESVTFAGEPADYEQLSSTEIVIQIPEGSVPGEIVITTRAGSTAAHLDVDLGYNVYLYNDFDGGGFYTFNEWWNSGDITDPVVFSDTDGFSGNYAQITWSGSTANGWGNTESSGGANPGIEETNQADVFFVFEAFCSTGGSMQIQIDDGGTVWAHDHTFSDEEIGKWVTVTMSCYDFGRGYDPSNQTHDMDMQSISKIKVAINNWTGVVPTTVRVDNLRFHGYY